VACATTSTTVPTLSIACKPRSRPPKEAIAVYLCCSLLLSLDDLLAVMREFVCLSVSRSGLDRCLRRHGVGNLRNLLPPPEKAAHKPFKAYLPGYLHMDVKYLP